PFGKSSRLTKSSNSWLQKGCLGQYWLPYRWRIFCGILGVAWGQFSRDIHRCRDELRDSPVPAPLLAHSASPFDDIFQMVVFCKHCGVVLFKMDLRKPSQVDWGINPRDGAQGVDLVFRELSVCFRKCLLGLNSSPAALRY